MHVVVGWSNKEEIALFQIHVARLLSLNSLFVRQHLQVLIIRELVVLKLIILLVECGVVQTAKDESEEDTHVGVVMQWHPRPFLDKEQYKTVVL